MPAAVQLEFPSLDFPGRTVLYPHELAERLGCTVCHVHDLIEEGELAAIDIRGIPEGTLRGPRRCLRVPVEAWRDFVSRRLSGPARSEFLRTMPHDTLRALHAELTAILDGKAALRA